MARIKTLRDAAATVLSPEDAAWLVHLCDVHAANVTRPAGDATKTPAFFVKGKLTWGAVVVPLGALKLAPQGP
jgi:hypothetical protein